MGWERTSVSLGRLFKREKVLGFVNEQMLSVYRDRGVVIKDEALNPNKTAEDRSIYQLVDPGWLVVNRMKAWQGSVGISPVRGIVSGHYICFRPTHREEDRFLHYLLRSAEFTARFAAISRGVRPRQIEIDNDELAATRLGLPERTAQRRIAHFLDDQVARIDNIIAARSGQRNLLAEQFSVIMRQLVAGDLYGKSTVRPSAPWIPSLGDEAREIPLSRTVTLQRGVDLTAEERQTGDVPVVTTAGVVGHHNVAIVQHSGVVIGRYGSVGNVHWIDQPHWPHNTTLYVRDYHGNQPRWVFYLLRSYPYEMLQARAAVPGINRNDMAADLMPWIPVEQQVIAADMLDERSDDLEPAARELKDSEVLLGELKRSLITAAVTGEFDVSTANGSRVSA